MIQDQLLSILKKSSQNKQSLLLRNSSFLMTLLKEPLQDYVLNFVYNHPVYKKLIFTGGTCLRKIYGLPRLSEDLDFDFRGDFDIRDFAQKAKDYFQKDLQYKNLTVKIAGNLKTVFLKFPQLLAETGWRKSQADRSVLFLRCDFSKEKSGGFKTEVNSLSTQEFTFFVLSYDLATLFSNKIIAFLQREFFKGREQSIAFKGRDLFDLVWFFEKSSRSDFQLQPNWPRVFKALRVKTKKEVLDLLVKKVGQIEKKDVYRDLRPYIESQKTVQSFGENFKEIIETKVKTGF